MKRRKLEFGDSIQAIFPEYYFGDDFEEISHRNKTITFQVTEDCSLRCSYCYQGCKKPNYMTFDIAKKFIDYLFEHRLDKDFYFSEINAKSLVIEFIGGEPFLCIDLINEITEYFENKLYEVPDSIWFLNHCYSFSTNGVAYFEPKVQEYIKKYDGLTSISVTVDGCKELHDKCRLFPDGSPSYDLAIKAALAELEKGNDATKITQSPDNISYTFAGIKNMIELGFRDIEINSVFEEGWDTSHAKILYEELKKVSDWLIKENLQDEVYIRLFDSDSYNNRYLLHENDSDRNWCGSTSAMCALNYKGEIFPCLRFMESSLNGEAEPYVIGDLDYGIGGTDLYSNRLNSLYSLTKSEQSTDECLNCPIEAGCSWCTGYNYQHFGRFDKRATYICYNHKAAALASLYFYKKCNDRENYNKIKVTKDLALDIISEDEWNNLQWR